MSDQVARLPLAVPLRSTSTSGLYETSIPMTFKDMGDGTYALVVAAGAGESHLGSVGGIIAMPSESMTRPADTAIYASGDLVANSTSAGSVAYTAIEVAREAGGSGVIPRVRLHKTGTSVTSAAFRVHLFSGDAPAFTNGDNGVFIPSNTLGYLGAFEVVSMLAGSDGASGEGYPLVGPSIGFDLAGSDNSIHWCLEARGTYTPASAEVFTLTPEVWQN